MSINWNDLEMAKGQVSEVSEEIKAYLGLVKSRVENMLHAGRVNPNFNWRASIGKILGDVDDAFGQCDYLLAQEESEPEQPPLWGDPDSDGG